MKLFYSITSFAMGLVLSRFAISKLAGWDISVQAFIEMARPLQINPTTFRITTGFLILTVTLGYLSSAILVLFASNRFKFSIKTYAMFASTLGLLTMIGALIAEFALRTEPKWILVYIAASIVIISAINLGLLRNTKKLI